MIKVTPTVLLNEKEKEELAAVQNIINEYLNVQEIVECAWMNAFSMGGCVKIFEDESGKIRHQYISVEEMTKD